MEKLLKNMAEVEEKIAQEQARQRRVRSSSKMQRWMIL